MNLKKRKNPLLVMVVLMTCCVVLGPVYGDEDDVTTDGNAFYGPVLNAWLDTHSMRDRVDVVLHLNLLPTPQPVLKPSTLVSIVDEDRGQVYLEKDGVEISEQEAEDDTQKEQAERERVYRQHEQKMDEEAQSILSRLGWVEDWQPSGNRLIKNLSKSDLLQLQEAEDLIDHISLFADEKRVNMSTVDKALVVSGLKRWGHLFGKAQSLWARRTSGKKVSIYMQEANGDCPSDFDIENTNLLPNTIVNPDPLFYTRYYRQPPIIADGKNHTPLINANNHALDVYYMLRYSAPDAQIHCGFQKGNVMQRREVRFGQHALYGTPLTPPKSYDLANMSWGVVGNPDHYTDLDAQADELVYQQKITGFIVAMGNQGKTSRSVPPGSAYNAITVSHYDQDTGVIPYTSVFKNPVTGAEKPELTAPGNNLCISKLGVSENSGCIGGHLVSGSSFAAPLVTGMAANLMQRYTWIKGRPTRLKGLLMAGAAQKVMMDTNPRHRAGVAEVGAGAVDFHPTTFNFYTFLFSGYYKKKGRDLFAKSFSWRSDLRSGSDYYGRYIELDMVKRPLIAGVKYRLALTWLVPPRTDFQCKTWLLGEKKKRGIKNPTVSSVEKQSCRDRSRVDVDFNMDVYQRWDNNPSGFTQYYPGGYGSRSAYELVEFVASQNGVLTVRIREKSDTQYGRDVNAKQQISVTLTPVYPHSNTLP